MSVLDHLMQLEVNLSVWGSKLIETLSLDLQNAFPETQGFSAANFKRMRRLAEEYPTLDEISAQPVRQLPCGHILVLLQKLKEHQERRWYAYKIIEVKTAWSLSCFILIATEYPIHNRLDLPLAIANISCLVQHTTWIISPFG